MTARIPADLIAALAAAITRAKADPEAWAKVQARAEQIKEGKR